MPYIILKKKDRTFVLYRDKISVQEINKYRNEFKVVVM